MSTPVTVQDNADQQRVEARLEDGTVAGFAEYRPGDDGYLFFHTEVSGEYEGQGIGGQLAGGVMNFARSEGVKIVPRCSFIRSYMANHENTHDLLAEGATLDQ